MNNPTLRFFFLLDVFVLPSDVCECEGTSMNKLQALHPLLIQTSIAQMGITSVITLAKNWPSLSHHLFIEEA